MEWIEHDNQDQLAAAVACDLADICARAIAERGRAVLALAGGSTPLPAYQQLARASLDWPQIQVLPSDERWVAHDHPACNLAAMQAAFKDTGDDQGAGPDFIALTPARPGARPELETAQAALDSIGARFDACLLGMGADGHFASLFPHAPELDTALDPACDQAVVIIHPDPLPTDAPYARISLTLPPIIASRRLLLVIRGQAKRDTLNAALRDDQPKTHPIAALLRHAGQQLTIHWSP
ncbi:MAG: 6-phosphogluconolactonase [Wenzhouxiangellaceae bacterium]|nr:6-phosphogluconolactonase [Wenzhouxiangellaceae bacterium]